MIKNTTIQHLFGSFKQHYLLQFFFPNIQFHLTLLDIKGERADIQDEIKFFHRVINNQQFFIFYETFRLLGQIFQSYIIFDFFHDDLTKKIQSLENKHDFQLTTDFFEEYLCILNDTQYIRNYLIAYLREQDLMDRNFSSEITSHPTPDLLFKLIKQLLSTEILMNAKKLSNLDRIIHCPPDLLSLFLKKHHHSQEQFEETISMRS